MEWSELQLKHEQVLTESAEPPRIKEDLGATGSGLWCWNTGPSFDAPPGLPSYMTAVVLNADSANDTLNERLDSFASGTYLWSDRIAVKPIAWWIAYSP